MEKVWKKRLFPLMRLTTYLLVVGIFFGYIDYRVARASVSDRLLSFGAKMAPYLEDKNNSETPRRIVIDGLTLWVASGYTHDHVATVRRWFAGKYAETNLSAELKKALERKGVAAPNALNQFEFGDDKRGGVLSLDMGTNMTVKELRSRIEKFAKSHDFGDIGKMRYTYLQATMDGGTQILSVWTDGEFKVDSLGGGGRDVAGKDPAEIPRFTSMKRTLTAYEDGMPYRMAAYEVRAPSDMVAHFYRTALYDKGWREDDMFSRLAAKQGRNAMRLSSPDGTDLTLDLEEKGGQTSMVAIANR